MMILQSCNPAVSLGARGNVGQHTDYLNKKFNTCRDTEDHFVREGMVGGGRLTKFHMYLCVRDIIYLECACVH